MRNKNVYITAVLFPDHLVISTEQLHSVSYTILLQTFSLAWLDITPQYDQKHEGNMQQYRHARRN